MGRMSERTTLYHLTEWKKRFISSLHPRGVYLTVQEIAEAPSEGAPGRMLKVQPSVGALLLARAEWISFKEEVDALWSEAVDT